MKFERELEYFRADTATNEFNKAVDAAGPVAALAEQIPEGVPSTPDSRGIPVISTQETSVEIFNNPQYKLGYVNMQWMEILDYLVNRRTRKDIPYYLRYQAAWDVIADNMRGLNVSCIPLEELVFIHTKAEHLYGRCNFGFMRENPVVTKWPKHVNGKRTSKCLFNNLLIAKPVDDTRKGEVIAMLGEFLLRNLTREELTADKRILQKATHASVCSGLFNKKTRASTTYSRERLQAVVKHMFSRVGYGEDEDSCVRYLFNYLCSQNAEAFLPLGAKTFSVFLPKQEGGGLSPK